MKKLILLLFVVVSCAHNSYESASERLKSGFKEVALPFPSGTKFHISHGPFDSVKRIEGNEYNWNFDVPYGTPVTAIEEGKIVNVFEPNEGGGCDRKFLGKGHHIRILHPDNSMSMYLHIKSSVKKGQFVKQNEVIGTTAENGIVCSPQLHFFIHKDGQAKKPQTIPLRFKGIPGGVATKGYSGTVP